MRHHYVYQIENLVNGCIYVGKHSTENMDDGYMGKGKLISQAIAKYGLENFRKTILREFESADEAFLFESQIVDANFVSRDDTYNLVQGGAGGERNHGWTRRITGERYEKLLAHLRKNIDWTGCKHREDSKMKIGRANSIKQKGELNSMHGKVWIHHDIRRESIAVKRDELESYINCGWVVGRKMKW